MSKWIIEKIVCKDGTVLKVATEVDDDYEEKEEKKETSPVEITMEKKGN